MPKQKIRVGSRRSRLAVIQTELVIRRMAQAHPDWEIETVPLETSGDILKDQPLDLVGGKGLFTLELEQAMRQGKIDLSVHSLKDMPQEIPDELPILAFSEREDPRDALVLPAGAVFNGLDRLKTDRPVGCSSRRRRIQLFAMRGDLPVEPVRGNVPTRIQKLDDGQYGALVLAMAGLKRLGLAGRASYGFSIDEILPAAGQGILAVQGNPAWREAVRACLNDPDSETAACAERAVIAALGCGCSSPAAAYARLHGTEIEIRAMYVDEHTGTREDGRIAGDRARAEALAEKLAGRLLKKVKPDVG